MHRIWKFKLSNGKVYYLNNEKIETVISRAKSLGLEVVAVWYEE